MQTIFDVIVVGGGHAGTEAALASARMGMRTLLLTHHIETLGQMSCNPAIGGIGKGHLVKEIDALGGVMARAIDQAGIHFRILNASKGQAVRATRAQADRVLYKQAIRQFLETQPNLFLFQQAVDDIVLQGERACGVITQGGQRVHAKAIILTAGTFLGGKIHMGMTHYAAGRAGDLPANTLAARLRERSLRVGRLKTGTPPRLAGSTIDFSVLEKQMGDDPTPVFSFIGSRQEHPSQTACYITHTNEKTHTMIREGLIESPLYTGKICGIGPRYCPSIEDKVVRFADKTAHQIFVEPEGLTTQEWYPNGLSTSLPFDRQLAFMQSIRGFEKVHITRPGYAIEYDFFDPRDLKLSLETKAIGGLFFAGQINGTTGYEEAAAQGIIAGINAACFVRGEEPFYLKRSEAYIGVLIDDLITRGVSEPYRMFTSRAEYRLSLREDNADWRLTPKAYALGLIDEVRWRRFETKYALIEKEKTRLTQVKHQALSLLEWLKRPEYHYADLAAFSDEPLLLTEEMALHLEIEVKYAGYIARQAIEIARLKQRETLHIPAQFNYDHVRGLSHEARERLKAIRPETIGVASRIPGMTPAAISLLLVYLKKYAA